MNLQKTFFLKLSILLIFATSCSSENKKLPLITSIPDYTVTVAEDNIRRVDIDATLPLVNDTLYMSQSDFAPLADGYAAFVHDLKAFDGKGNLVSLTSIGKGMWKVAAPGLSAIRLTYYVTIGHDSVQWAVSQAFARAYVSENVLFFAGRILFIAARGTDDSKIKVHFNLPGGWDVATAYSGLDANSNNYQADNLADLWRNGNFIGRFVKEEINVEKLKVIIAGTYSMKDGVILFKSALNNIVNSYSAKMGGAPEGKLVIMGSLASFQLGGETFKRSISLMFPQTPTMANKGRWGYLLAHEVFHLWNGHAISPADQPRVEWFVEGFTEYMSKLTAFRTGFISESEYLRQLANSRSSYLSLGGKISLEKAGIDKGPNYSLIYDGGLSVALALDIETRRATNNTKGFTDIMNKMYARYGKTNTPYTFEDIIKVSSEVAGHDLSGFFSAYVSGVQVIPIDKYLGYAGLEVNTQNGGTITTNANASPQEKSLLKALLAE